MTKCPASQRFNDIADNFATSEVHRTSPTIQRLHERLGHRRFAAVCDIACGAGHLGLSFAERAGRIVGTDSAPNMLESFRQLAADRGVSVEAVASLADSLPFFDGEFDLVISRLAPHHFSDIQASVLEMARITAPGGVVAVIDLEGDDNRDIDEFNHSLELLHDPTHVRSYREAEWAGFFKNATLTIETLENKLSERPSGVTVKRWCEIASSGKNAELEIRKRLEKAPCALLEYLGIRRMTDGEFLMPIRTVLIIGRKS